MAQPESIDDRGAPTPDGPRFTLDDGDFDEKHPLMVKYPSRKSRKHDWFPGLTPEQKGTLLRIAEEEWEKRED